MRACVSLLIDSCWGSALGRVLSWTEMKDNDSTVNLDQCKMADFGSGGEDVVVMDCEDPIIPQNPEELAELKKENGNQLYKIKQYRSALNLYTEAIELCPDTASYYSNRSACYMMLNRFQEALEDARTSTRFDPNFAKGHVRILKCALALGDLTTAHNAIARINEIGNAGDIEAETKSYLKLKQYEEEARRADEKHDYRKIVYCMDRCLDEAPTCTRYKLTKAENLAFLGRYQEAQELANNTLHLDRTNADAIYVRGLCLYYEDNIDDAFNHFQQVLRFAPDHKKALAAYKKARELKRKKEGGNDAYKNCKFQEAFTLYTEALAIDPLNKKANAKLYFNRATVQYRLAKIKDAVGDCNAALNLDDSYLKALLRRASCYTDLGEYEEAVKDYERVCKLSKTREHKKLLQDAKFALKKSKRKDYYKILGIERSATDGDIKKAYRKKAMVLHPDRHANATDAVKKDQEKKFKEVGEAYGILSDPKKKARYDSGQDMDEFEGGMSDIDPSQVFRTFFNQPGSGGGCNDFNFGNGGGGFPGGFTFQFG